MENDKKLSIEEFNALVTSSEGPDRNKQEECLIKVLIALMSGRLEKGVQPSDDRIVLDALGITGVESVSATITNAGTKPIYSAIARMLLDNSSHDLDVARAKVACSIQK